MLNYQHFLPGSCDDKIDVDGHISAIVKLQIERFKMLKGLRDLILKSPRENVDVDKVTGSQLIYRSARLHEEIKQREAPHPSVSLLSGAVLRPGSRLRRLLHVRGGRVPRTVLLHRQPGVRFRLRDDTDDSVDARVPDGGHPGVLHLRAVERGRGYSGDWHGSGVPGTLRVASETDVSEGAIFETAGWTVRNVRRGADGSEKQQLRKLERTSNGRREWNVRRE